MMHYANRSTRRASFIGLSRITFVVAVGGLASGCIDPNSPLIQKSGEGCNEFQSGATIDPNLDVNPQVLGFMQAASDFTKNAESIKNDVFTACKNIATDLGVQDTWTSIADSNDRISNASHTGACDAAGTRLEDMLIAAGTVNAHVALTVSRGECHLDFDEQARCDASCAANATCSPGTIETRCEPGSLSVMCGGSCNMGASCVGTADVAANCMGKCESECVGQCAGDCIDEHGQVTTNNPSCHGKCASSCNGTCRGHCKVEATQGIACGANVRCTGGCTGSFTEPACVSDFTPPTCTVDPNCHAACTAKVEEDAVCDPTVIKVFANVDASPDIQKIVDTLNQNLSALFDAANKKGKLVLNAAGRLGDTGDALKNNLENLDGKSLACLGKAATAVGGTIGSINVTVNASVDVTVKTTEHTE